MARLQASLPENLRKRIEDVYEEAGYNSRTELVRDATRRRLEEVEMMLDEEREGLEKFKTAD